MTKTDRLSIVLLLGLAALLVRPWRVLDLDEFTERPDSNITSISFSTSADPHASGSAHSANRGISHGVTKRAIAAALRGTTPSGSPLPVSLKLRLVGDRPLERTGPELEVGVEYTLDEKLQTSMAQLIKQYSPDYGAFIAMDAKTGKILALVSHEGRGLLKRRDPLLSVNDEAIAPFALRSSFPSASVFKVVTAAAAIERHGFSPDTVIPFSGRNHTLYRSNVLSTQYNRWTRYITLKDAFAKSINTVFGKIGINNLQPNDLREYAARFFFNREIPTDLPVDRASAAIPDDTWGLAEAASGYTRENTMSPLHGALIAAAVANDGHMPEPYIVQQLSLPSGERFYEAQPQPVGPVITERTSRLIREMMVATVEHGTSRGAFRGFSVRGLDSQPEIGGKTGSLTGTNPKGKYDWFVGYLRDDSAQARLGHDTTRRIAFAALTVNIDTWKVKSSYLVRKAVETVLREDGKTASFASK